MKVVILNLYLVWKWKKQIHTMHIFLIKVLIKPYVPILRNHICPWSFFKLFFNLVVCPSYSWYMWGTKNNLVTAEASASSYSPYSGKFPSVNRNYAQVKIAWSGSSFEYLETVQFRAKNDVRMQWSNIHSLLPCCSLPHVLLVLSYIGSSHLMTEKNLRGSSKLKWEYSLWSFSFICWFFALKQVEGLWVHQWLVICTEFFPKSILEQIC